MPVNCYRIEPVGTKGYGPRIWLPVEVEPQLQITMDRLSIWGGSDRRENGWISWEIHDDQLLRALSELQNQGLVELKPDPHSIALDLLGDRYGDPGIW